VQQPKAFYRMLGRTALLCVTFALAVAAAPVPDGDPNQAPGGNTVTLETAQIKDMQQALNALGLYKGPINGRYDRASDDALRAFRLDAGINTTRPIDSDSLARLRQRAEAATLLGDLQRARQAEIARARAALLSDPATRDLVGQDLEPANAARDSSACLRQPTVRCLLGEAGESAMAVTDTPRRDWAFAEVLAVQTRAGLSDEALLTLRRIEDPRRILRALRDIALDYARRGDFATALSAASRIPDPAMREATLALIAGRSTPSTSSGASVDSPSKPMAGTTQPRFHAIDLIDLAMVRIDARDAVGAQELLEEGAVIIASVEKSHRREYPRFRLALARLALAEQTEREEEARAVITDISEPHLRAQAFARLAALQNRLGLDAAPADAAAQAALAAVPSPLRRIWTAAEIAMALMRDDAPEAARRYLEKARTAAASYTSPWGRARALARLADAYLQFAEEESATNKR
jgi:tetratricopeptide (TPR) repeat protein